MLLLVWLIMVHWHSLVKPLLLKNTCVFASLAQYGELIFKNSCFSGSQKAPQGTATQPPELIFINRCIFENPDPPEGTATQPPKLIVI